MREARTVVREDAWTAWPVYWTPVIFGGAVFSGWYAGLAPSPAAPAQAGQPVDPNAARAAAAGATAAAVAILLGLAGSVVGGWMGSGERMDFSFYSRERVRMGRPVA